MDHSLRFDLAVDGDRYGWRIYSAHSSISSGLAPLLRFPSQVSLQEIRSQFTAAVAPVSVESLRIFGRWLWDSAFASEAGRQLVDTARGELLFVIPEQWADIPFEMAQMPGSDFLGNRFRTGTVLAVNEHDGTCASVHDADGSLLIIADPAGNLPHAYEEGVVLKNCNMARRKPTHLMTAFDREKLLQRSAGYSMLHFAGRSFDDSGPSGCGWDVGELQVFGPSDMRRLGQGTTVPFLVFSNSCYGGYASQGMRGIAGVLLQTGIPQVIGPVTRVSDTGARRFAAAFYENLERTGSVAEALMITKRDLCRDIRDDASPYLYRLFGDPGYSLRKRAHQATQQSGGALAVVPRKGKKGSPVLMLLILLALALLVTLLFIPLNSSPVLYIPGR